MRTEDTNTEGYWANRRMESKRGKVSKTPPPPKRRRKQRESGKIEHTTKSPQQWRKYRQHGWSFPRSPVSAYR